MPVSRSRLPAVLTGGFTPVLALLALCACGTQKHREAGLVFKEWYVVKPLVAGAGSVAYGSMTNEAATPQTLKKAEFACASASDLHETLTEAGRVRMAALPGVNIAPGETVLFEPAHKHVMLQKIEVPNDEKCNVTFTFETATVRFTIPIRERKK